MRPSNSTPPMHGEIPVDLRNIYNTKAVDPAKYKLKLTMLHKLEAGDMLLDTNEPSQHPVKLVVTASDGIYVRLKIVKGKGAKYIARSGNMVRWSKATPVYKIID